MILVVGATGFLGSEICRRLAAEGWPVKGLVRATADQTKLDALKRDGVSLVQGDLRDRASLDAACRGVTAVIATASSMPMSYQPGENDIQAVDLEGVTNLILAAQASGVEQFVYISFTMDNDFPLRKAKRLVEQRLVASELDYTILRPSYFMETWLSPVVGFDVANARATIYGSGQNPISWISFPDVAQFAVKSLDNPAARNATLALGGPEALTPLEAVGIFEEISGRLFEVEHVPEGALEAQQQAATDPMEQSFAGLMRWYAQGDPVEMQDTLRNFPVALTSVKAYAGRLLVLA